MIDAVNEIDLPPSAQLMVSLFDANDAVTDDGFGGRVPSS